MCSSAYYGFQPINMAKDYIEDLLIQKSTAELLKNELGWKSVYAFDNEVLGGQVSAVSSDGGATSCGG